MQKMNGKIYSNKSEGLHFCKPFFLVNEVNKMIVYIANENNINLLDSMAKRNDWEIAKTTDSTISLNDYLVRNMQIISDVQFVVLEKACVEEQGEDYTNVLDNMCSVWDVPVIILEDGLIMDEEGREKKILAQGQVIHMDIRQDNLARNIEHMVKGEEIPAEEIYDGIWIGVMSSNSGAGATAVAIGLTNYIHSRGESVCYVEANESGDLAAMADFYNMSKIDENHYERNGVDYWHQSIDSEKKYVVIDLGKYSASKLSLFQQCKIKNIVTDGKPYRMADANNVMKYVGDDNANLIFNFTTGEEFEALVSTYQIDWNVYCLSWHPDMFEGMDNTYAELLKDYIPLMSDSRTFKFLMTDRLKKIIRKNEKSEEVTTDHQDMELDEMAVMENIDRNPVSEVDYLVETDVSNENTESKQTEPEDIIQILSDEEAQTDIVEENPFEEPYIVTDQKPHKGIKILNSILLLILAAGISIGTYILSPDISDFLFKNREQENTTTELVDEQLNINPDIKISVIEVDGADGYEVSYSTDQRFPEEKTVVVEVETADKAVESLAAGKTYYVRVRAFKYNEDGTKVYGDYTDVQEIDT